MYGEDFFPQRPDSHPSIYAYKGLFIIEGVGVVCGVRRVVAG